jgi:hypothetical protein
MTQALNAHMSNKKIKIKKKKTVIPRSHVKKGLKEERMIN